MIFTNELLVRVILLVLGALGFFVAKHIRHHKKEAKPLVCPMNLKCDVVVHSDYSKFLGMPVEVLGMFYYCVISIFYLVLVFVPGVLSPAVIFILVLLSTLAFLFSLYLILIQMFVIKEGCFWCFVSALVSILIFALTIYTYGLSSLVKIFA